MPCVQIRPVGSQDAELLYAFYETILQQTRTIFGSYRFTMEHAQEIVRANENNSSERYFVAVVQSANGDEEKIVGLFWFWNWISKVPWFGIMVTDAWQNRGVGRQMMSHAISDAKQQGKGGILLTTAKTNLKAQALYKRYQFEMMGEGTNGEYLMILNFPDPVYKGDHNG